LPFSSEDARILGGRVPVSAMGNRVRASLSIIPPVEQRSAKDKLIVESFLQSPTEEAFFPLFEAFFVRIRGFFLLHGLDIHGAEDLSQEVFFKVYRKATELREPEHFFGWIYTIARNVLISHWRQQKSRIAEAQLEGMIADICNRFVSEADALPSLRLREWLGELEADERDLLILRFVEGLSYQELADTLDVPLGTIKWRVSAVKKKLSHIIRGGNDPCDRYALRKIR